MPGMLLCGRRWMIGSDDLVLPFSVALNIRFIWLVVTCIILGIQHQAQHGHSFLGYGSSCGFKMDMYLLGYIILLTGTFFLDLSIVYISSRGTIFRDEKRRMVPALLYGRMGVYILELLWLVTGIYLIFIHHDHCSKTTDHILSEGLVIGNLVFMLCVLFAIYFSFDTAGHIWYKMESLSKSRSTATYGSIELNDMIKNEYEKNWKRSCKALFCCSKIESSTENVFGFIARQLAEYFHDQLNLVPSDIVAGLILLRRHQQVLEARQIQDELDSAQGRPSDQETKPTKRSFKTVLKHQRTINCKPFDFYNEEQRKALEDAVYFSNHTMAIYGWPGYLYRTKTCSLGLCRLCCNIGCCRCCRPMNQETLEDVVGDNCCVCNVAATKLALGLDDVEFVYTSYHDEVFEPPFFVAVDHKKKAIIVSCRGTMSLKDVLTDLMIEEERIPVDGGDPTWKSHSGMLQSAKYVLNRLQSDDLITKALAWNESKGTQAYRLTLVGHSLGAGVASILAFLLRPKYPDLICYAYSPPGITFNYAASKGSEDFIYSVVIGKDVIPRLNVHTFHELKFKLVQLIQSSTLPKWRILRGCLCQCMLCCSSLNKSTHEDYLDIELPDLPPYPSDEHQPSYVGGKVIHLVKTKSMYPRYIGRKKAEYEAVWTNPEALQTILISTLMWKDHLPDSVHETLHKFFDNHAMIFNFTAECSVPRDDPVMTHDDDTDQERGTAENPESVVLLLDAPPVTMDTFADVHNDNVPLLVEQTDLVDGNSEISSLVVGSDTNTDCLQSNAVASSPVAESSHLLDEHA